MKKLLLTVLLLLPMAVWAQLPGTYLPADEMSTPQEFLPGPPALDDALFFNDWVQYQHGKVIRTTERGRLAIDDASTSVEYFMRRFGQAMGVEMTPKNCPNIARYISRTFITVKQANSKAKYHYARVRPYNQFHEDTPVPGSQSSTDHTSYPSGHTCRAWSTALALVAIDPDHQNEILKAGYDYGQSRVILGYHYQSDVDAARLVASAGIARLMGEENFREDMARAKAELDSLRAGASQNGDSGASRNVSTDMAQNASAGASHNAGVARSREGVTRIPQAGADGLKAVDFTAVSINDSFLASRIRTNAEVTIPHSLQKCEDEGRFDNFINAAKARRGEAAGHWRGHWGFDDSDVYKVLEGMAFTYNVSKDPALDARMDEIIALIADAQQDDGYLYTAFQLKARDYTDPYCTYKEDRYDNLRESHEFYNMGHMYEAAAAHFIATGKRNFLDVALKSADHIYSLFGPDGKAAIPGHQEIELGLLKLTQVTGDDKYARLAKLFLDRRGTGIDGGEPYYQNDERVVDQKYARGHAVRANYMYTAMAEIAALTGDKAYTAAVDSLWEDVVGTKLYITGGMGQVYDGEAYAAPYFLPNNSYAETCAAIAGVFWNQRMFLLHGESKYIDVLERILYNGLLSGVSLDGTKFFYPNPMVADMSFAFNRDCYGRSEWFDCSCCPTNDCRFISSLSGYVYATRGNAIYQNLYVASRAKIALPAGTATLVQKGDYPWDGRMTTTVETREPLDFALHLRIPSWTQGKPIPGDLYSYTSTATSDFSIKVNGKPVDYLMEDGYAVIQRRWKNGDVVETNLPMEVHEVIANEKVEADAGLVALERGPLVYCFEEVDNGPVARDGQPLLSYTGAFTPQSAGGISDAGLIPTTSIQGAKPALVSDNPGAKPNLVTSIPGAELILTDGHLVAVPYCLWNNRTSGSMSVWLKR